MLKDGGSVSEQETHSPKAPIERVRTMPSLEDLPTPSSTLSGSGVSEASSKCTKGNPRILKLNSEQKAQIESMAGPREFPADERKRQYSALRRAVVASADPGLLAKLQLCSDSERPEN